MNKDNDNNNKIEQNPDKNKKQLVSDDELLSKLLEVEDGEQGKQQVNANLKHTSKGTELKKNKIMQTKKSTKISEIVGATFVIIFIVTVITLIAMKYSKNCGMLGSTVEGFVGNFICPVSLDSNTGNSDQQMVEQNVLLPVKGQSQESKDQLPDFADDNTGSVTSDSTDKSITDKVDANSGKMLDSNSKEIIDDPFADTTDKDNTPDDKSEASTATVATNKTTDAQVSPNQSTSPLTQEQNRDLAATFGSQSGDVQNQPPPKPIYETPALLISEKKQKITNRQPVKIKSIGFRDGQEFKQGDVLVTFDCKQIEYDLEIQQEVLKDRNAALTNLQKLRKLKSTSEYSVVKAESELGQTKKLISKYEDQLDGCVIKAEYDGKVIVTNATEGEFLFAGKEIMTVNNNDDLLVKAYIPVDWLTWLGVGTTFELCVASKCYNGVVNRIGAEVDAISQTLDVFGRISTEGDNTLISGLSGQIKFDKP